MMKSQATALLLVTRGLCKDVLAAYPALEGSLSKDIERIALYSRERGLGLYTLDLPHLESLLLKGLETGRLCLEGPLTSAVSKRIQVPRLYSGLWLRIFGRDACLKQDVDVNALFFLRSLLVIGKKVKVECSFDRRKAAIGAYHGIERSLRSPSMGWSSDDLDVGGDLSACHLVQACEDPRSGSPCNLPLYSPKGEKAAEAWATHRENRHLLNKTQLVADLILGSFNEFCPITFSGELDLLNEGIGFRHGPGAVAERLKNWEKSQFPNWPQKLQDTFPFELCGKTIGSDGTRPLNHEVASRLYLVPKTAKVPRLIAAEPTSHQWCQQLLLRFLFDQCRKNFGSSFIDFKDQTKSGRMVLKASLDRSLATVDLSEASDRLTCWTVERMFRSNKSLLLALHAARTRYLRDDNLGSPNFLKLRKFASQGTATTFPVMSLVMLIIALAASLPGDVSWSEIRKLRTKVRVFGDDIIIPSRGYARLLRIMELVQLKVNVAKSYVSGQFRESCGTDGFNGHDVTPVKPEVVVADSPASCQAVVDTTNNLFNKGLWHASNSFKSLLPAHLQRAIRIVGPMDAGKVGLSSFCGSDERHLRSRWNRRLHRYEVRVWSLRAISVKRDRQGFSTLLDFMSRKHNPEQARDVSQYVESRKSKGGLLWEPSCCHDRVVTRFNPERGDGEILRNPRTP